MKINVLAGLWILFFWRKLVCGFYYKSIHSKPESRIASQFGQLGHHNLYIAYGTYRTRCYICTRWLVGSIPGLVWTWRECGHGQPNACNTMDAGARASDAVTRARAVKADESAALALTTTRVTVSICTCRPMQPSAARPCTHVPMTSTRPHAMLARS
jgi:hypothetical protein